MTALTLNSRHKCAAPLPVYHKRSDPAGDKQNVERFKVPISTYNKEENLTHPLSKNRS